MKLLRIIKLKFGRGLVLVALKRNESALAGIINEVLEYVKTSKGQSAKFERANDEVDFVLKHIPELYRYKLRLTDVIKAQRRNYGLKV